MPVNRLRDQPRPPEGYIATGSWILPNSFLLRPKLPLEAKTVAAFGDIYAQIVSPGSGGVIEYNLTAPKWQFLCYLCDRKEVLVHGSGNPNIAEFEPRKANDIAEFGDRCAVYAASDGIWAMYFAIVNRRVVKSLVNGCARLVEAAATSEPYYFFSIDADALSGLPWRDGTVYILPRDSFERQPNELLGDREIEVAQWASSVPVKPLARLSVTPEDFPFLAQVRPHYRAKIRERALADPAGFPWIDG